MFWRKNKNITAFADADFIITDTNKFKKIKNYLDNIENFSYHEYLCDIQSIMNFLGTEDYRYEWYKREDDMEMVKITKKKEDK